MGKDVKIMVISEWHPDTLLSTTKQAKAAVDGTIEYIKHEVPDVIIIDDPCSNIRYPEIFDGDAFMEDPLEEFMKTQFEIAKNSVSKIHEAVPSIPIYIAFTDASWYSVRRLTSYRAVKEIIANKSEVDKYKSGIASINAEMKKARKWKRKEPGETLKNLGRKKGGLIKKLQYLEEELLFRMPRAESPEYIEFRKETSENYKRNLQDACPYATIAPSLLEMNIKGNTVSYWHNGDLLSKMPKKNRFKQLLEALNKGYIKNIIPPDFVLSSGHDGFASGHPLRHDLEDVYSFVATGMVMEDQRMVKDIAEGRIRSEIFQDKPGRLESVRRYTKSYATPGITIIGRRDGCPFIDFYSMHHLANIGSKNLDISKMEFETIPFLGDIHLGKGATLYDKLESALQKIKGENPNLIVNVNETLQARNYPTMPVETPRKKIRDLNEEVSKLKSAEEFKNYILHDYFSHNEPAIMNQVNMFNYYMVNMILGTLIRTPYDVGYVTSEPTHMFNTVGEFGISEVDIQTEPFIVAENILNYLEEEGYIKINNGSVKHLVKKIMGFNDDGCGWGHLKLKMKDLLYDISVEHKPGSATPESNIPLKGIERMKIMSDKADIKLEGHLHSGYGSGIPIFDPPNSMGINVKAMTFNNFDSYGKKKGWSPATVGYIKLGVPINKNGKGTYKVTFVTHDNL